MTEPLQDQNSKPSKIWYVDDNCIMCSLCIELAPDNIEQDPSGSKARFFRQPDKPDELAACIQAQEQCPTQAIKTREE